PGHRMSDPVELLLYRWELRHILAGHDYQYAYGRLSGLGSPESGRYRISRPVGGRKGRYPGVGHLHQRSHGAGVRRIQDPYRNAALASSASSSSTISRRRLSSMKAPSSEFRPSAPISCLFKSNASQTAPKFSLM